MKASLPICALAVFFAACGQNSAPISTSADSAVTDTAVLPDDATSSSADSSSDTGADFTVYDTVESIGLWTPIVIPGNPNVSLHGVWSDGSTRVVTAGTDGTVIGWDGLAWNVITSGKFGTLNAVAGSPGGGFTYAVGLSGAVVEGQGKDGHVATHWGPPGGCNVPADCDDSDSCTIDICDSGICQHSASGAVGCCGGVAFADSFDKGLGKWTVTDSYNGSTSGGIVWSASGIYGSDGTLRAASPPAAAYFGRTDVPCSDDASKFCASYDNGKSVGSVMTSQEFAIPNAASVSLTFQLFLDVESGFADSVQISVLPTGGSKKIVADKQTLWPTGSTSGKFQAQTLDLTNYAGQKVKLEVRFESYGNSNNSGQGVFLDDLVVSTACKAGSLAGKGLTGKTLFGAWAFADNDAWTVGESGFVAHWDGSLWNVVSGASSGEVDGMTGAAGIGILAAGVGGLIGQVGSGAVVPAPSVTDKNLKAIAIRKTGSTFSACAVGDNGVTVDSSTLSASGNTWKVGPSLVGNNFTGIAGTSSGWIACTDSGAIAERSGSGAWTTSDNIGIPLHGIASTPSGKVVAVGDYGLIAERSSPGSSWGEQFGQMSSVNLNAITAVDDSDIWVVGDAGFVGHWDGSLWTASVSPTPSSLRALYAASSTAVYAVGLQGGIIRFDGTKWTKMLSPSVKDWYAVWGNGPDDVYALGTGGAMIHWDGKDTVKWKWKAIGSQLEGTLRTVWGIAADDVWAAGELGTIYHYDGASWTLTPIPDYKADENAKPYKIKTTLLAIWGAASDDVWAAGEPDSKGKGVLVHWDGTSWAYEPSFAEEGRTVRAIWGWKADRILIAGTQGMALRFDAQGNYQDLHPNTIATLFGITAYGKDALLVGDIGTVLRWTPLD